jgi:hypothetical protein
METAFAAALRFYYRTPRNVRVRSNSIGVTLTLRSTPDSQSHYALTRRGFEVASRKCADAFTEFVGLLDLAGDRAAGRPVGKPG